MIEDEYHLYFSLQRWELPELENGFQGLKRRILYPTREVVIDEYPEFTRASQKVFPGVPIQLCIRHLYSCLVYYLRYESQGSKKELNHSWILLMACLTKILSIFWVFSQKIQFNTQFLYSKGIGSRGIDLDQK